MMLANMWMGLTVMVLCLFVQALLVAVAAQFYGNYRGLATSPNLVHYVAITGGVMLILVLGNLLQIAIWALLFSYLGEFQNYPEAVYHSAVNFSTLGYGDIVMSESHRLLGPMQAINGVLMIGVSTAVMMSALQDVLRRARETPKKHP
jgi:hypothetical protein